MPKSINVDRYATEVAAFLFTLALLVLGFAAFGLWTMLLFTSGFLGGFILWLLFPAAAPFGLIKAPYFLALALFALHRVEEYASGFFESLAWITGVETPAVLSWQVILLILLSVGGWLSAPILMTMKLRFGSYLAWTFFAAMSVTELAHIVVFPWLTGRPVGYFPGMASVVLLAPVGWWGMRRLALGSTQTTL